MIWLLTASALAGTAGVEGLINGSRTSARHRLDPGFGAWVSAGPRPWSVTGELTARFHDNEQELYRFSGAAIRASATLDLALGTHTTTFRAGVGPALTVVQTSATLAGSEAPLPVELAPGVRVRIALDGPIAGPLAFCWHAGATTRRLGIDWDAGLGLGVAW